MPVNRIQYLKANCRPNNCLKCVYLTRIVHIKNIVVNASEFVPAKNIHKFKQKDGTMVQWIEERRRVLDTYNRQAADMQYNG